MPHRLALFREAHPGTRYIREINMGDPAKTAGTASDTGVLAWVASFTGLKIPGVQSTASPPVTPQLKLGLTKDEQAKCEAYFDSHVSVVLKQGGAASKSEDYVPALDGTVTTEDAVTAALMALTTAGFSATHGGSTGGALYDGTKSDVAGIVKQRVLSAALKKAIAAPSALAAQVATGAPATVPRAAVQAALAEFFNKVMAAQKGKSMRIDEPVRQALQGLTQGLPGMAAGIVPPPATIGVNPAQFAAEVANKLPDPFPAANLAVLQRLSPKAVEAPNNSASDVFAKIVGKEVNAVVSLLPKALQDPVRKAVVDGIAVGLAAGMGALAQALSNSTLDDKTKTAITKSFEAALKEKENGPPMDRKADGAGSPNAPVQPPPIPPPEPKAPDPDVTKSPEIKF